MKKIIIIIIILIVLSLSFFIYTNVGKTVVLFKDNDIKVSFKDNQIIDLRKEDFKFITLDTKKLFDYSNIVDYKMSKKEDILSDKGETIGYKKGSYKKIEFNKDVECSDDMLITFNSNSLWSLKYISNSNDELLFEIDDNELNNNHITINNDSKGFIQWIDLEQYKKDETANIYGESLTNYKTIYHYDISLLECKDIKGNIVVFDHSKYKIVNYKDKGSVIFRLDNGDIAVCLFHTNGIKKGYDFGIYSDGEFYEITKNEYLNAYSLFERLCDY